MVKTRNLGKSDIKVSALGFGCWAIGGPFWLDGLPDGWGKVDDNESIRAIEVALDHGINFFDTADAYGVGHSEEIIGKALKGRRDEAVIATKFGFTHDTRTKHVFTKTDVSPEYIRQACEASLKRLDTEYIDLYQIHTGGISEVEIITAAETLDRLKSEGKIRAYGFSTWDVEGARVFAENSTGVSIQHPLNVLHGESQLVDLCEQYELSSINNAPLAMGLLSGKFDSSSRFPSDDVRGSRHEWVEYFQDGRPKQAYLDALESVKEILQSDNRNLVQGALAWLWANSDRSIPIPGLKTSKQVKEAAKAMSFGPLRQEQMTEIDKILRSLKV